MILQPPSEQQSSSLVTSILFANCLQVTKFQTFPSMKFSICPQYSNSAMNPLLYAGLSDNFRKSFRKVSIPHLESAGNSKTCLKNIISTRRRAIADSSGKTQTPSPGTIPSQHEEQSGARGSRRCCRRTPPQGTGDGQTRPPISRPHLRDRRTAQPPQGKQAKPRSPPPLSTDY